MIDASKVLHPLFCYLCERATTRYVLKRQSQRCSSSSKGHLLTNGAGGGGGLPLGFQRGMVIRKFALILLELP